MTLLSVEIATSRMYNPLLAMTICNYFIILALQSNDVKSFWCLSDQKSSVHLLQSGHQRSEHLLFAADNAL